MFQNIAYGCEASTNSLLEMIILLCSVIWFGGTRCNPFRLNSSSLKTSVFVFVFL